MWSVMQNKLLILGGTAEARELAQVVHECLGDRVAVITSYSGISGHQPDLPGRTIVGGFTQFGGLGDFLEDEDIKWVIDATHPYAEEISTKAYRACLVHEVPLLALRRPAWQPAIGDRWLEVSNLDGAAEIVSEMGGPVLLTIGIKELARFSAVDNVHFVVRLLKEPDGDLPLKDYEVVVAAPPYGLEEERQLLQDKKIRLIVCKNSGGEQTRAKLVAARENRCGVVMVDRPLPEPGPEVNSVNDALRWLNQQI